MKKYTVTTPNIVGETSYTYNELGMLVKFETTMELTLLQHSYLFENMPTHETLIKPFVQTFTKGAKLVCEDVEITFDQFYAKYNYKVGKKEAVNAWKRMSKAKQIQAFNFIDKYFASIRTGIAPKYPATYLNSEPWND